MPGEVKSRFRRLSALDSAKAVRQARSPPCPSHVDDYPVDADIRIGRSFLSLVIFSTVCSFLQLLQDLSTLRSLLDYVFRYDAVTFYQLLLAEKRKAAAVRDPPLWIGTVAAERCERTERRR